MNTNDSSVNVDSIAESKTTSVASTDKTCDAPTKDLFQIMTKTFVVGRHIPYYIYKIAVYSKNEIKDIINDIKTTLSNNSTIVKGLVIQDNFDISNAIKTKIEDTNAKIDIANQKITGELSNKNSADDAKNAAIDALNAIIIATIYTNIQNDKDDILLTKNITSLIDDAYANVIDKKYADLLKKMNINGVEFIKSAAIKGGSKKSRKNKDRRLRNKSRRGNRKSRSSSKK